MANVFISHLDRQSLQDDLLTGHARIARWRRRPAPPADRTSTPTPSPAPAVAAAALVVVARRPVLLTVSVSVSVSVAVRRSPVIAPGRPHTGTAVVLPGVSGAIPVPATAPLTSAVCSAGASRRAARGIFQTRQPLAQRRSKQRHGSSIVQSTLRRGVTLCRRRRRVAAVVRSRVGVRRVFRGVGSVVAAVGWRCAEALWSWVAVVARVVCHVSGGNM